MGFQAHMFRELAAATLAAKGYAVPAEWAGAAPVDREKDPAAVVRAAAGVVRRPERPTEAPRAYGRAQAPADPLPAAEDVLAALGHLAPDTDGRRVSSRYLYECLVRVALDLARERGYRAAPSQVTFLMGSEAAAAALGVSYHTVWRRLKTLQAAGLVAVRPWKVTIDAALLAGGEGDDEGPDAVAVNAGTLVAVRLAAGRARLTLDDLRAPWRDLGADIRAGRTWRAQAKEAECKHDEGPSDAKEAAKSLLTRALPPRPDQGSRCSNPCTAQTAGLAELFDLPGLAREDRSERVDAVARGMAAGLRDTDNLNLYRWTIWQAVRLATQGQTWALGAVHDVARRVIEDARDPNAARALRKPGARFVAALKESGVWDGLKAAPAVRVGTVRA